MNEFDLENYDRAVGLADEIFAHAERIHNVFDNIDELMGMLHGTHWGSAGSEDVNAQYLASIKTQFEPFYQDVVAMKTHVYTVTEHDIQADQQAASNVQPN